LRKKKESPMHMRKIYSLFLVFFLSFSFGVSAQMNDTLNEPSGPQYLLLDKGLQFRITESVNSMYNFDFKTAERGFMVLKHTYPQHPLPDFLIGLSQWWKIAPNMEDTRYDKRFISYMDSAIYKAEKILKKDPENKEAAFFLAGAHGFKGRLYSERKSWTKATFSGKNALKYLELSRGDDELNPELILGDALFNYFSVWIPENYPLLKPILALFPKGDKKLGLKQLEDVSANAFYARVEAQYFLFRLYSGEEKKPYEALNITSYLNEKYPNNAYFHRFYARQLYAVGRGAEAKDVSLEILKRIDEKQTGYESNSGRYAAFFVGQYYERVNDTATAKKYYEKAVAYGEESESQESGYYLYSLLHLGKIATKENNKPKAKRYFKEVKKYAKRKHPVHQEARDFIKKNNI